MGSKNRGDVHITKTCRIYIDSSKQRLHNFAKCLVYKDKYNGRWDETVSRSLASGRGG